MRAEIFPQGCCPPRALPATRSLQYVVSGAIGADRRSLSKLAVSQSNQLAVADDHMRQIHYYSSIVLCNLLKKMKMMLILILAILMISASVGYNYLVWQPW
jgi:hypothetical protein